MTPRRSPVLVRQVADDGGLMEGGLHRRVHLYTTTGRIYQHKRAFVRDSDRLREFVERVKAHLRQHDYRLASLNKQYWTDVTELVTQREASYGMPGRVYNKQPQGAHDVP